MTKNQGVDRDDTKNLMKLKVLCTEQQRTQKAFYRIMKI